MIEASVIAAVKKRKNEAFKVLYQRCIAYVYSIVRRYVGNESEHPDVIQEIFARVFLSIQTFDAKKGDFKFWLRRLVINQCLQHHRKSKATALLLPLDSVEEIDSGEDHYLHELDKVDIEKYLQKMPMGYRQIFLLVIIDDYTYKEAADLLGVSVETCRSQLSRAKVWLKKNVKLQIKNVS